MGLGRSESGQVRNGKEKERKGKGEVVAQQHEQAGQAAWNKAKQRKVKPML